MCAVSFVGDSYKRHFVDIYPKGPIGWPVSGRYQPNVPYGPTQAEFDELKKKVEEMIALLKAARQYDVLTGQADCQMEEKMAFLRKIAALVGVNLDEAAFGKKSGPQPAEAK